MDSGSHREFIDQIRREKFGVGTTKSNPLAGMLHEAIVHLSAELYQKDIHFISELLQNAEDNVYGEDVAPSLELVLTKDDVARVGAPATLILFNNEVGFQPQHVEALCAVGLSTKKGKRDSGYIGEKGIGFKSVFLVTKTPYIISNGYRFRFTDDANNEAKIGYVVPEWIDVPTDADLRRVYGKQNLPQTIILLPLREEKVNPVQEQLKQISPETLLFLSKLRQLNIRQDSGKNLCITRSDVAPPVLDQMCKTTTVNLTLGSSACHVSEASKYCLLQQQFPVTHPVDQRKEVDNWNVTLAFPWRDRINPGGFTGDIYAFLPSYLTSGFPFVVNADFLLVASRETLKFDSPWNIGILSCIPRVFLEAFNFFLRKSNSAPGAQIKGFEVSIPEAYRYIPVKEPQHPEVRKVRQRILKVLAEEDCVLIDSHVGHGTTFGGSNIFCKPQFGRFIDPDFHSILRKARSECKVNPAVNHSQWFIIDGELQREHREAMELLGVYDMPLAEYIECLSQKDWLLSLSEELYCEVVFFVMNRTSITEVPLLKYCREDDSIALKSVKEVTQKNGEKLYFSPLERGAWLSKWTAVFKPWVSVLFMPTATARSLKKQAGSQTVVKDLSIKSYLRQLLELLPTSNDPTFIILTTDFMYQCVQGKDIELKRLNNVPVVDQSGRVADREGTGTRFLPAYGSKWPQLSLNSWSSDITVMSDDYIRPPSSWTSRLKASICNKEDPFELEPYRNFLRNVFGASDVPNMIPASRSTYRMPEHLRLNMTIQQADLLLEWLTSCFKKSPFFGLERRPFVLNLKETKWLPTEKHGLRKPSSCFERSSFSVFFSTSDIPYTLSSIRAYSSTLESLGVVTDIEKGTDAVINYLSEIYDNTSATNSWSLDQATRFYRYLQKYSTTNSQTLKIFVPGIGQYSHNSWKDSESCVIHNADGFFHETLTVLEDLYPGTLLPFFRDVLKVPRQPTVERYCQLWLKWRSDVHEITLEECTQLWKILSEKWANCDVKVREHFKKNAWVPSRSAATGDFKLSSPRDCFIPDDLDLASLFSATPDVQFVWYPDNTEKIEVRMNKVYVDTGVRKLSESVQQQFNTGDRGGRDFLVQNQGALGGDGILCPNLFRAILGFLARKKCGLPSSERQSLVKPLKSIVQVTITEPITSTYTIFSLSPQVVATKSNVMALWSRTDGKFYCIDKANPLLQNSLIRRDFHTQFATTISCGLLSEHPSIAEELTEFINGLVGSEFEASHVDYELRRKRGRLFDEDETFLAQLYKLDVAHYSMV